MTQRKLSSSVLISVLFLAACGTPKISRPNVPETIDGSKSGIRYSISAYQADLNKYKEYMDSTPPNYERAKIYRDRIINRIREQIELVYCEYELKLAINLARFETGADVVEAGLSGAVAAVGGESIKTILGIALSGTQATRLSISKNYFRQKTTEIIITAMRGSRQNKLNQIIGKMELPAEKYILEEARADLVEFFYAGTLQGAMQTLAADSGKKEADAKLDEKNSTEKRIEKVAAASEVEETDSKAVRDKFRALKKNNDDAEAQAALAELGQRGITIQVAAGAHAKEIYEAIDKELEKLATAPAANRAALLPKWKEALEKVKNPN